MGGFHLFKNAESINMPSINKCVFERRSIFPVNHFPHESTVYLKRKKFKKKEIDHKTKILFSRRSDFKNFFRDF